MRAVLMILLLATAGSAAAAPEKAPAAPAAAKPEAKAAEAKPPRKPGPHDANAVAILEKIAAGPDAAARTASIEELIKVAPHAIEALGEWLQRPHATDEHGRRMVLAAVKAAVPDESGRFATPPRQTGKQRKADDEIDWLPALLALDPAIVEEPPPPPTKRGEPPPEVKPLDKARATGEVIADIAAIRALAATKDTRAAQLVFDTAFHDATMIYRDECGRYIRKMEPYSIPAIIRESQGRGSRRRYATYQLERMDRQDPNKALDAALGDEALQLEIIDVYRKTKVREAVGAVWIKVNDDSPRIRAAARAAWMEYITGKAPRKAPRKKLMLPGGKLTKEEKPLWLNYRELADTELRKAANALLHEDYPLDEEQLDDKIRRYKKVKIDLVEVTNRLFAYYDGERAKQEAAQWAAAKAKSDAGDLATATTMLDRLITQNPERSDRTEIAKIYVRWAKQLEGKQQWAEASAAYSKAHGLDPDGAGATDALAAHHYALGKSLEAAGKDGGPDFRRAIALKPDYAPAEAAAERASSEGRPVWMLYGAATAGIVAMLLFAMAMIRRRA